MISLEYISKQFGTIQAVSHVTLDIESGEIVGLLGPNGAGKTTTMRMMAGVLPQSGGSLEIDGMNFFDHEHILKQKIGYLPENNPLYDDMTVEEHLMFWGRIKGLSDSQVSDAVEFAVDSTGIGDVYYRFIGELSKGYRQRVGLSQAILSQPDILLLDEPTEGLDPNQRADIQKLLVKLGKHRTVIISSHVLSEISQIADRIVIIHNGSVVGDDTPDSLISGVKGLKQLEVIIKGRIGLSTLKNIKGVVDATTSTIKQGYILSYEGKDIRESVFDAIVKSKAKLLGMRTLDKSLEDVFAELTKEVS